MRQIYIVTNNDIQDIVKLNNKTALQQDPGFKETMYVQEKKNFDQ